MASRERTRILFVHHRSELGGAPTSLSYLIGSLDREEFEPHVYCPAGPSAELFRNVGAVVHTGPVATFTHIWASSYRGRRWLVFLRELMLLPGHVAGLSRTLSAVRPRLVHLNDSPLIAAGWLAHRRGIPVVWHLRSALPGEGNDLRSRLIRRFIRRTASASIAINDDVKASFDIDSEVVPNTVDLEQFRPGDVGAARRELGIDPERNVVAFFGFIYPSKGFREFIHAAAMLRDRGVGATYLIVGGAVRSESFFRTPVGRALRAVDLARNYEREAKELVASLELTDSLRFVRFTSDTAALYRASDIVVAPSRGAELGRPLIEAAASGVPVVASGSRTGGGVVVPGETGVLVDDFSVGALADAIGELVVDSDRRKTLGEAARRHAEVEFDAAAGSRRVVDLYHRILAPPERTRVLYVHHRPQLGGAPSSLAHLIANLDSRFEPHVLCPPGPAATLFEEAGAHVHTGHSAIFAHVWDNPYEGLRWLVLMRELANVPAHVRELDSLLREYRFPIVHLNDSPLLPAGAVAHRRGAKVVWHLRSALAGEGLDRRSRAIVRLMERWGDAAISIDRDVAARFRLDLPLTIVHNSVRPVEADLDPAAAKRQLGLPEDRVLIGFAGFIRRPKGWPEFVDAAGLLVEAGVPAHFVIMGGGIRPPAYFRTLHGRVLAAANVLADEETRIKELVRAKGIEDQFSFLPFTPHTGQIYPALDIVTFPNQGVGLGRPVLEAAMHGKPVVASGSIDGGGVLVDGVTGILLRDPQPASIAGALRRLVEDPALRERMGRAAGELAREEFDPERNARAVERVYDEILGVEPPGYPAAERAAKEPAAAA
jgi:glycosyltransferase involved in cell wall biosynthesis